MAGSATTWRAGRLARFLTRLPSLLSRHLWVWPITGAVVLIAVGLWVRGRVERVAREEVASRLKTLLDADVGALRVWFSEQEADARSFAADVRIREAILELARIPWDTNSGPGPLVGAAPAQTLHTVLRPLLESQHYVDYVVLSTNRYILASPHPRLVGRAAPRGYELFLERALRGQTAVSRPFARETQTDPAGGATMFVATPVNSPDGDPVAVLALRMRPEDDFNRIFSVARMGDTGEAYAFDRRGVLLTGSRFDSTLRSLGLIANTPGTSSIFTLRLLDPGEDLEETGQPAKTRGLQLTRMAHAATRGVDGVDVQGYRNYLGKTVVGAWTWLPKYGMGVAVEVSALEAFRTFHLLRQVFLVLFLLLILSAGGIFSFTVLVERLQASLRKSGLAARRLGQYVLTQEIGRGASGMVYCARHLLLRRPVAIKLLSPDLTNETTAAEFEHEVQMTSQLTHPNTVAIYDYGRTPEGLFYYAMEFLSGINLDQLGKLYGPQPEGRVIHILRQVCGSLAEAHRVGLIHRDIKPANLVLTRRGGVCDLVKVLDFGLVKARHPGRPGPGAGAVVGTPHFISPEAVTRPEAVDARSDLYSVGAVGYWLLTGRTLFESSDVDVILNQHAKVMPPTPSAMLRGTVSPDLERIIMACLAKAPEKRPPTAEALEEALAQCASAGSWNQRQAEKWWTSNPADTSAVPPVRIAEKTVVIARRG